MALKIYAYGFVNYWRDGQNRFDFVITCVIGDISMIKLVCFVYKFFFTYHCFYFHMCHLFPSTFYLALGKEKCCLCESLAHSVILLFCEYRNWRNSLVLYKKARTDFFSLNRSSLANHINF